MEKSTKYYWAVFEGKDILFGGSFSECWAHLLANFADMTMAEIDAHGICIARAN